MGMRVCYEGEGRRFGSERGLVVAWVCSFCWSKIVDLFMESFGGFLSCRTCRFELC